LVTPARLASVAPSPITMAGHAGLCADRDVRLDAVELAMPLMAATMTLADLDVVADLDQVVDLRAPSDARRACGRAVDAGVRADLDVVAEHQFPTCGTLW
jgi:hypothetical protein